MSIHYKQEATLCVGRLYCRAKWHVYEYQRPTHGCVEPDEEQLEVEVGGTVSAPLLQQHDGVPHQLLLTCTHTHNTQQAYTHQARFIQTGTDFAMFSRCCYIY